MRALLPNQREAACARGGAESPRLKLWQQARGHLSMPAVLVPHECVCLSFSLVCSTTTTVCFSLSCTLSHYSLSSHKYYTFHTHTLLFLPCVVDTSIQPPFSFFFYSMFSSSDHLSPACKKGTCTTLLPKKLGRCIKFK